MTRDQEREVPRPRGTYPHRCTGRDCPVCERIAEERAEAKRGG